MFRNRNVARGTGARLRDQECDAYGGRMNEDSVTPIGQVDFREDTRVFGITRKDRRYHMLAIGRTGTGKSTLLGNLIRSDLERAEGVAVIDPHGDLAEQARDAIPVWRQRNAIYFDPADPHNQIQFNPLYVARPEQRHLVVSELITILQQIFERAWGSRLEHILRIALLTLTEKPGHTLLDALRLFDDSDFRKDIVEQLEDDILKRFWIEEFGRYSKSYRTEAIAPIQNKLGEFLINPALRKVFESPEGDIKPRALMDEGRIFIANLSVGRLGRDVTRLLGATLTGAFSLAALSRADVPADQRQDFYCYIDEFPLFASGSVDIMLSETRKYRLCLTFAMQYLEQVDPKLLASILGNVGNVILFRVGARDAAILEREMLPVFSRDDLISIPYHHMYVRMMINHKPSRPFSAKVLRDFELRKLQGRPKVEPKTRETKTEDPAWP